EVLDRLVGNYVVVPRPLATPVRLRDRNTTDDRVIGCAFSFARSRVRAFNGSMFWLGQRAARARLDGGERRGHMQPNTPRRKNARTRERGNARTKTRNQ